MDQFKNLRHADITDAVTCLEDGSRVRITGFYDIETRQQSHWLGGGTILRLRPCAPISPTLAVIGTYAVCGRFHRPWELEWRRPIPWPPEVVEEHHRDWRERMNTTLDGHEITSSGYPEIFERFPSMSNHEKALLAGWRIETDRRIRAHEASLERDNPKATLTT